MRVLVLLTLVVFLAGCSRPAPESPPPVSPPPPPTAEAPRDPPAVRRLFPLTGSRLQYLRDEQSPTVHELLTEQERIVVVRPGAPALEWRFDKMGAWLADPDAGTLLRYLPVRLEAGTVWRQGDTWFRLDDGAATCRGLSWPASGRPACWDLVVLEQTRRTLWTFGEGYGPVRIQVDDWADPGASHVLRFTDRQEMAASVSYPAPAVEPLPLSQGDAAGFSAALAERLRHAARLAHDMNADGIPELATAESENWVSAPLTIFRPDGSLLYRSPERHGLLRASAAGDMLVVEYRPMDDVLYNYYTVLYMRDGQVEPVWGWGTKGSWAFAHRFRLEAGEFVAEFDLGDPAGHTRVTRYRLEPDNGYRRAAGVSVAYVPSGSELVYPATPEGVLTAALVARWFGLGEELPRYFASPDGARVLAEHPEIKEPMFLPGTVELTAPPSAGGWADFTAVWNFYESSTRVLGRVRFGSDPGGRPVILELLLDQFQHSSV